MKKSRGIRVNPCVNYSEPHSQNCISRCLLFAHVVTSSHQFCRTVLRMQAFDACQGCFAGSRVNYSEPHSQNRISRCLLFAHVVTSSYRIGHILTNASIRRICPIRMTLNSLHVKTATSHKFSAQRIVGKAFTGHTQEIFQELQKSLGLVIFRFALVDLEQQRLCELL